MHRAKTRWCYSRVTAILVGLMLLSSSLVVTSSSSEAALTPDVAPGASSPYTRINRCTANVDPSYGTYGGVALGTDGTSYAQVSDADLKSNGVANGSGGMSSAPAATLQPSSGAGGETFQLDIDCRTPIRLSGTIATSTPSSPYEASITGIDTASLAIDMKLTKSSGDGAFGAGTSIKSIDSSSQITIQSSSGAHTNGSITFDATQSIVFSSFYIQMFTLSGATSSTAFKLLDFGDASGANPVCVPLVETPSAIHCIKSGTVVDKISLRFTSQKLTGISGQYLRIVGAGTDTDYNNQSASRAFSHIAMVYPSNFVAPDSTPPVVSGSSAPTLTQGASNVVTLSANEAVTWSISGGTNAALFGINQSTGALSFVAPAVPGTYTVTVRAADNAGNTTDQTITVTVNADSGNAGENEGNNNGGSSTDSTPSAPTIDLPDQPESESNGSGSDGLATASAGQIFTLTGTGMNNVDKVKVGGKKAVITSKTATKLGFRVPKNLPAGVYDLSLYGSFGSMTEAKFFSVAKKKVTQTVVGFEGNSSFMNTVVLSGVTKVTARLGGGVTLVCKGSTSGFLVTKYAKALARERAVAACDHAKKSNPGLVTKIRISPASAIGSAARNVYLTYKNY